MQEIKTTPIYPIKLWLSRKRLYSMLSCELASLGASMTEILLVGHMAMTIHHLTGNP